MLHRWDYAGSAEMTEYWRCVVPALSIETNEDRSDVDNDRWRVKLVRERYALELKHIGTSGSLKLTTSRLTRLYDWSVLTPQERVTGRRDSPFALCRGVPSGLSFRAHTQPEDALDFAILISVPPELLPSGPLFLEGVPLVVQAHRRFRPLPGNADERCPPESASPSDAAIASRPCAPAMAEDPSGAHAPERRQAPREVALDPRVA